MAEPLGSYRITLEFEHGTAHWGGTYSTAEEADGQISRAREEHPDATGAHVVSLVGTDNKATWEKVS